MYYVRDAKWHDKSARSQFTAYPDLATARSRAVALHRHPYYDYEIVPIYIKKFGKYVIYGYVRHSNEYEGPEEDIPTRGWPYVYRDPKGTEYLMDKNGELSKVRWNSWFRIVGEYPNY